MKRKTGKMEKRGRWEGGGGVGEKSSDYAEQASTQFCFETGIYVILSHVLLIVLKFLSFASPPPPFVVVVVVVLCLFVCLFFFLYLQDIVLSSALLK